MGQKRTFDILHLWNAKCAKNPFLCKLDRFAFSRTVSQVLDRSAITGTRVLKNVPRIDPRNDLRNDLKNDLRNDLKNVPGINPRNDLRNDLKNIP